MPVSSSENKSIVQDWYRLINPDVIVDIGPGEGTYAKLLQSRSHKAAMWVGIEAWGPYITHYHLDQLYDEVIIADARYVHLECVHPAPDLVIVGDVLEHMSKEEARGLLNRLRVWAPNIIISIPLVHLDQGPVNGNWFEIHKDHWKHEEMLDTLGMGLHASVEGDILGYYWWSLEKAASWVTGEMV